MGNGKTDLSVGNTGFREEAGKLVALLGASADALENLPFINIHSVSGRSGDIDAALQGRFRLRNEEFTLAPPVDWWGEPYRMPGERGFFQNSFVFADALLADPRFLEVLEPLATIFADWLSANPQSGATYPHRYAWHDHAAAGRLVVMAFVLREGVRRSSFDSTLAEMLAAGVLEHAQYLLADQNHAANNHGLFSDAALALSARSLAPAPQATVWAELAKRRFAALLDHTIDDEDAIYLEHSPYYHWVVHGALKRFAAAGLFEGLDLSGLAHRMEESGAWLVAPDGTLPPIGDTPTGQTPPKAAQATADFRSGIRLFRAAGYAVIRDKDCALIVTAAHHPTAHKHADDGSFCLYENGRPLIVDSGDPGYDYDSAERHYGTSPAAHSTVCIDGFDWARERPPYGSGIVDASARDDLYAILTRNPNAIRDGGITRRLLIYTPRRFLVIVDDVQADASQLLTRHLPLAPNLNATATHSGEIDISHGPLVVARLTPFSIPETEQDGIEVIVGRRFPHMAGFTFPTPGSSQPRCSVVLSGPAGHPRAYALTPGSATIYPSLRWRSFGSTAECEVSNIGDSAIQVRITEDRIESLVVRKCELGGRP